MVVKTLSGNLPVYQVSGTNASRSLPDWLVRKRKRSLKNDPDFANRVELIQDFEFQEASNRIKVTRDGQFAMATGTYKPQIHVYDFSQLSLKFERHTDAENVDFAIISDDWTKSLHLQNDRSIELHAQGGIHTSTRIPRFGRCIEYNRETCDAYVGATGSEIYRLNLEQGRFMAPFESESDGVNAMALNPAHGLLGAACENGTVEFWDPRTRRRVGALFVGGNGHGIGSGVTALDFHAGGLYFAAGTFDGLTQLYDLRASDVLLTKDQGYGFPIKRVSYIRSSQAEHKLYSADKRSVKIWDTLSGDPFASMEPTVDINDVAHIPESGMFFLANEGIPMHTYYLPGVGPAPKWCSFLDSITEELEEKPATSVYDNYKFVTTKELANLNLSHLVGSNVVKAYMHGYFIDQRLYDEAKLIADPFAYREHRDREIRKKIEEQRESRIRSSGAVQAGAKVNKKFANTNSEVDDRFKAIFQDPEFEIDEKSFEYKLLHGGKAGQAPAVRDKPRERTAVEEENDEVSTNSSESDSEQENRRQRKAADLAKRKQRRERQRRQQNLEKESQEAEPSSTGQKSFGERIQGRVPLHHEKRHKKLGDTEVSFVPRSKPKAPRPSRGDDSGRSRPRNDKDRRRASKNALRV